MWLKQSRILRKVMGEKIYFYVYFSVQRKYIFSENLFNTNVGCVVANIYITNGGEEKFVACVKKKNFQKNKRKKEKHKWGRRDRLYRK